MKSLVYDTSAERLAVGVFEDGAELASFGEPGFARHAEMLVPSIARVLREAGTDVASLDAIGVGTGPGSFTGLRVGVVAAKAFAAASGVKLVELSSLEAIAHAEAREHSATIGVLLDAKKNLFYGAIYAPSSHGRLETLAAPALFRIEDFLEALPRGARVVGGGAEAVTRRRDFEVPGDPWRSPELWALAEITADEVRHGCFVDPRKLEPRYLHPRTCNATPPKPR